MKEIIIRIVFVTACSCFSFNGTVDGMQISTSTSSKEDLSAALLVIKNGNIDEFQKIVNDRNISLTDNIDVLAYEAIESKNKDVLKFIISSNSIDCLINLDYFGIPMPLHALDSGDIDILNLVCNRKYCDVLLSIAEQRGWSTVINHAMSGCNVDMVNFTVDRSPNDVELDIRGLLLFGRGASIDDIKALYKNGKSWLSAKALSCLLLGACGSKSEEKGEEKVLYLVQLLKNRGVNNLDELDNFCSSDPYGLRVDLDPRYRLRETFCKNAIWSGKNKALFAAIEWMTDTYLMSNFSDFCRYACEQESFKSIAYLLDLHQNNYRGLEIIQIDIGHGLPDLLATVDAEMTTVGKCIKFAYIRQKALNEERLNIIEKIVQLPLLDINIQDEQNNTAAHYAIAHGDVNVLKLILAKTDVNLSIKNKEGKTARDLLVERFKSDDIPPEKMEEFKSANKEMEQLISDYCSKKQGSKK